jgi:acyl carrier protein
MVDSNDVLSLYPGDPTSLDLDLPILDQGTDSLSLVEWMYRIEERYGVIVDDERLLEMANLPLSAVLADFVAQVAAAGK